jgi:hypothetical protein
MGNELLNHIVDSIRAGETFDLSIGILNRLTPEERETLANVVAHELSKNTQTPVEELKNAYRDFLDRFARAPSGGAEWGRDGEA